MSLFLFRGHLLARRTLSLDPSVEPPANTTTFALCSLRFSPLARTDIAKANAEADGRIKQERVNHDLLVEKAKIKAKEERDALVESVKDSTKQVIDGLANFVQDRDRLKNTALTGSAIALGIYTAKVGTSLVGRFIEKHLGKPSLVRATSRATAGQLVTQPIVTAKKILGIVDTTKALEGIVLKKVSWIRFRFSHLRSPSFIS